MPAPAPNKGARIWFDNVGPGADIPGVHTPVTSFTNFSGTSSSSNGQIIQGVRLQNNFNVSHSNVKLIDVDFNGKSVTTSDSLNASVSIWWSRIRAPNGNDGKATGGTNTEIVRSEIGGYLDGTMHKYGFFHAIESLFHSPVDTTSDFFINQGKPPRYSSHPDLIQQITNTTNSSLRPRFIVERCSFYAWPWLDIRTSDSAAMNMNGVPLKTATNNPSYWRAVPQEINDSQTDEASSTSLLGIFKIEGGTVGAEYIIIRDCYVEGWAGNGIYLQSASSARHSGVVIIDLQVKKVFNHSGSADGLGIAKTRWLSVTSGQGFTYGRVVDADTGASIPPSGYSPTTAGPSSNYISWFDTHPEIVPDNPGTNFTGGATDSLNIAHTAVGSGGAQPSSGPYIPSGGMVVFEADQYDASIARSSHQWEPITDSGATFSTAMQSLPDSGTNIGTNIATTSPELNYKINFPTTGIWKVWIRGRPIFNGNTFHVGLDGVVATEGTNIAGTVDGLYKWISGTAQVNVTTTGIHTLNLYMREDGMIIDRVLLTTDTSYIPTDDGPASSPRADTSAISTAGDSFGFGESITYNGTFSNSPPDSISLSENASADVTPAGATGPLNPVTLINSFFVNRGNTATVSFDKPADLTDGQFMIVSLCHTGSATITGIPGGFTHIGSSLAPTTTDASLHLFYRYVTNAALEPSTYTITLSTNKGGCIVTRLVLGNVNPDSPIDVANSFSISQSTSAPGRAITTVTDKSMVLAYYATDPDVVGTYTGEPGAGFTRILQFGVSATSNIYIESKVIDPAGLILSTPQMSGTDTWTSAILAIKPVFQAVETSQSGNVFDNIRIAETRSTAQTLSGSASQIIDFNDTAVTNDTNYVEAGADDFTIIENIDLDDAGSSAQIFSIVDGAFVTYSVGSPSSDSISVSESIQQINTATLGVGDSIGFSEQLDIAHPAISNINQSIGINESDSSGSIFSIIGSDHLDINENIFASTDIIAPDSLHIDDISRSLFVGSNSSSDSFTISEDSSNIVNAVGNINEAIFISDNLLFSKAVDLTPNDSIRFGESIFTEALTPPVESDDSIAFTEDTSSDKMFGSQPGDTIGFSDEDNHGFTGTGGSTDIFMFKEFAISGIGQRIVVNLEEDDEEVPVL